MSDAFWNVFRETGEPLCYLLCRAEEQTRPTPEITPIPQEFKNDEPRPEVPVCPR